MLATVVIIAINIALGLGLHADSLSWDTVGPMAILVLVVDTFYIWSLVCSKLSLLLLYYRVFRFGYFKMAAYAIGALVSAWGLVATILAFTTCVPARKLWTPSLPGHCSKYYFSP